MAERMVDRYIESDLNGSSKYVFHSSDTHARGDSLLMDDGTIMDSLGIGDGGIFQAYSPEELGMNTDDTPFIREAESISVKMPGGAGSIPVTASPNNATYEQQSSEIAYQDGTVEGGPGPYEPHTREAEGGTHGPLVSLVSNINQWVSSNVLPISITAVLLYGVYRMGMRSGREF